MYIKTILPEEFSEAMMIRASLNLITTSEHLNTLITSSKHKNIKIFVNDFDKPVGYISWDRVSRETLYMMTLNKGTIKYRYEKNEGHFFVINDIVMDKNQISRIKNQWKKFLIKRHAFISTRKNDVVLYSRDKKRFKRKTLQRTYVS